MLRSEDLKEIKEALQALTKDKKLFSLVIQTLGALVKAMDEQKFFPLLAKATKSFYDALVKAGFTKEQALQIVASKGVGLRTSSRNSGS
jgi:hypothetical protein